MNNKAIFGLKTWMTSLIIVILFTFCIVGFAVNFILATNPTNPIITDSYLSNTAYNMNKSLNDFSSTASRVKNMTNNANSIQTTVFSIFLIFQAAFDIPFTLIKFAFSGLSALSSVLFSGLALSSGVSVILTLVISVIISLLVIEAILLFIRFVRTGQE